MTSPDVEEINRRLVERGWERHGGPRPELVELSGDREADELCNDLDTHPHAFVLACLFDLGVQAERAWTLPLTIKQRAGTFAISDLALLDDADWLKILREPSPAHRYPAKMSKVAQLAIALIKDRYDGDASCIWTDVPSSGTLVRRFLEFWGAGPKIATMAANILVRDFAVQLTDYRHIDVSADVHVVRVMTRLGLVRQGASTEDVIYAARELNPEFPGIIDLPLWILGRGTCRPTNPRCAECYMNDLCTHSA